MSKSLSIGRATSKTPDRLVPVSGEETYWKNWQPVIEQEGYPWLNMMGGGFVIDAENLPEVLAEVRQLKEAVPRYYAPGTEPYKHMNERLSWLIEALQELQGQPDIDLYLG